MDLSDLQDAIVEAADGLAQVAPSVGTKGKAYEVWIAFEIAVRLLQRGYPVEAHDPSGIEVGVFRVRGSPGGMPSLDAEGDDNPSHFHVDGRRGALEVHVGLQSLGVSGSRHEIDITVLPADAGEDCRDSGGGAYAGPRMVGLELKAYADKSKLDQLFARALVGVAVDVDPGWLFPGHVLVTFGGGLAHRHLGTRALIGLLTSTELYDNSRSLLEHHGMLAGAHVRPGSAEAALDLVVEAIGRHLGEPSPGWANGTWSWSSAPP